jgi:hypothetical protein
MSEEEATKHKKAYMGAWRERNRDHVTAYTKKRYQEKREENLATAKKVKRTLWRQFKDMQASAKRRGYTATLSIEEYATFRAQPCDYCKGPLPPTSAGLDRLDNTKGYDPGNVVPCCNTCNRMRGTWLTPDEMHVAIEAIQKYRTALNEPKRSFQIIKS